jgi:hypothetical protein
MTTLDEARKFLEEKFPHGYMLIVAPNDSQVITTQGYDPKRWQGFILIRAALSLIASKITGMENRN